ncbi:MAG: TonB family protein [Flavobacteriales bacterium]
MRNELELMDLIERYLDGGLDHTEASVMSQRIAVDDGLRRQVEEQRALRAGMERVGSRMAVVKAYRSYRFWKWAPWMGGVLLLTVIALVTLWPSEKEHDYPQPSVEVAEVPTPVEAPTEEPDVEIDRTPSDPGSTSVHRMVTKEIKVVEDVIQDTVLSGQRVEVKQRVVSAESVQLPMVWDDAEVVHNTAALEPRPAFPGGDDALGAFLMKNLQYPAEAERKAVQGRVVVSYIVMKDGTIQDIRVEKGFDAACDQEAMRVVRKMPNWAPGKLNGELVNVRVQLPIVFTLRIQRME